jgi:hypothetical protein
MMYFTQFGASAMPVQALCAFTVAELDNGNVKVRSSAIELLGCCYKQLGPPFKGLLPDDIKAASRTLVEAQFDKVGYDANAAKQQVGTTCNVLCCAYCDYHNTLCAAIPCAT